MQILIYPRRNLFTNGNCFIMHYNLASALQQGLREPHLPPGSAAMESERQGFSFFLTSQALSSWHSFPLCLIVITVLSYQRHWSTGSLTCLPFRYFNCRGCTWPFYTIQLTGDWGWPGEDRLQMIKPSSTKVASSFWLFCTPLGY
jgi:hypothetical protein